MTEKFESDELPPVVVADEVCSDSILDQKTIDILNSTDSFFIQQQIRWGEALTGGMFEQKNRYHIYNKDTNEKLFVSKFNAFFSCHTFDIFVCFFNILLIFSIHLPLYANSL